MPIRSFIDDIPTYEVREGNMHIISPDRAWTIPLRIFRISMVRAQQAIDAWDSRNADVLPFKRPEKTKGGEKSGAH